jgi:hypothetical protein
MSLRRQKNKDSLDLLLDTMCNTFGGIVLIAILVALLAGGRLQLSPTASSLDVSQIRTQAEEEVVRLQSVANRLRQRITDEGLERKVDLLRHREELQVQIASLNQQQKHEETVLHQIETLNPLERKAALETELEQAKDHTQSIQKMSGELEKDVAARKNNLNRLNEQVRLSLEAAVLQLRYPKEHETSKQRIYVLIKHGRLYPTENLDGGRNETTISWTELLGDSIARPRPSAGIDPMHDAGQTEALFAGINPQLRYVAFIVFGDSFVEFRVAQRYCVRHGLDYGWSPKPTSDDAIFSSNGRNPPPQ